MGRLQIPRSDVKYYFVNEAIVRACGRQDALEETDAGEFKCRESAFEIKRETGLWRGASREREVWLESVVAGLGSDACEPKGEAFLGFAQLRRAGCNNGDEACGWLFGEGSDSAWSDGLWAKTGECLGH
jgi:hypothetical protein